MSLVLLLLLPLGLAPALRQEWRLLFNSAKHGMSFSTFTGMAQSAVALQQHGSQLAPTVEADYRIQHNPQHQ